MLGKFNILRSQIRGEKMAGKWRVIELGGLISILRISKWVIIVLGV
jgi:hypothetical protein